MVLLRAPGISAARGVEVVRRSGAVMAAALGLFIAAGFVGYQQLFSSFASYDDEGYVLLSLRMFLAGRPLYDDVYSQYGPAYYVTQAVFHWLSGLPVTHDVARWKTLAVWLATAGMSAAFVQRMTGYHWLAAIAFLATFFHLDRLGLEPGHPQDVCLPAMMAMLLLSTFLREGRQGRSQFWIPNQNGPRCYFPREKTSNWGLTDVGRSNRALFAAFGALLGVIATTKLNLGLFCGLSASLALLVITRQSVARTALLVTFFVGALALPFVLLKHHAFSLVGARLPSLVVVGLVGLIFAQRARNDANRFAPLKLRTLFGVWTVAGIVASVFLGAALGSGTSFAGLYWGLIGQHTGFAADCYAHPPLDTLALGWSIVALGAVVCQSRSSRIRWWSLCGGAVLLMLLMRRYWGESFHPVVHGLYDRGWAGMLATLTTPLACVLLMRSNDGKRQDGRDAWASASPAEHRPFSRWLLAFSVLLQPLGVIPIPGTQLAIGTLPALLMLFIVSAELINRLRQEGLAFQRVHPNAALKALMIVAVITLGCRGWKNWERRSSYEPLALPGAQRLRLPHEEAARLRSTVAYLRERADTFVTLPCGFNSLYLLTELPPPTCFNTTVWDVLLDDRRQQAIVNALQRANEPRLVIYTNWPPVNRENAPLARYLRKTFTRCEVDGETQIWGRENVAE